MHLLTLLVQKHTKFKTLIKITLIRGFPLDVVEQEEEEGNFKDWE